VSRAVKRALKYRFYPTTEQAELLHRTFGCVRLVWNKALAERTRRSKDEGLRTSYVDTAKWLTVMYPRFRSKKKARKSAAFTNNAFCLRDGRLTLAKMSEPLDIRWSRPLPEGAQPSTVTVSQDAAGRWYVSLLVEETIASLAPSSARVGIDVGLAES
jgi:putative transposase